MIDQLYILLKSNYTIGCELVIDVPLRDMQINRVLGFLDEQLGDSDVTIVFADLGNGLGCLYSNRCANGYRQSGNIYFKEFEDYSFNEHPNFFLGGPQYFPIEYEIPDVETFTCFKPPVAWACSEDLMKLFRSHKNLGGLPDDTYMCHEASHHIVRKQPGILSTAGVGFDIIDEALSMHITNNYIRQHHPYCLAEYAEHLQGQILHPVETLEKADLLQETSDAAIGHSAGSFMALYEKDILCETAGKIREANRKLKRRDNL